MRSSRSLSTDCDWSLATMLGWLNTEPWVRSLWLQWRTEDHCETELERRLSSENDDWQTLMWFEREILSPQSLSFKNAATRGTVQQFEQLSDPCFSAVAEWLLPRFWSDFKKSKHADAVVARLREAYSKSALPSLLFACQSHSPWPCSPWPCSPGPCKSGPCKSGSCGSGPCKSEPCRSGPCKSEPCSSGPCRSGPCRSAPCSPGPCTPGPCAPRSFNPEGSWSVPGVAHLAYYLELRDSMSPQEKLRYLSTLARWYPAQAFMHVFTDLKKHSPLFTQEGYDPKIDGNVWQKEDLNKFQQAICLWLGYERKNDIEPMRDSIVGPMVGELLYFLDVIMDEASSKHGGNRNVAARTAARKSRMGQWINSMAVDRARVLRKCYIARYSDRQESLISAYLSGLLSWQGPSPVMHPPVGLNECCGINPLRSCQPYQLRQLLWMEEQLVCRLVHMLIDQHAAETCQQREDVIDRFMHSPSALCVSETTYRQLYSKALKETAVQVAIEQGYDFAWRVACAGITIVYGLSPASDSVQSDAPSNPFTSSLYGEQPSSSAFF
ncbi:hypothetical protein GNI_016540 [Gregarina niphandrodes]|uniref:Uncharacterized protein n=1 Tax=Gregarina niphandrodes TaxID=110365 RepID=A0A023BCI4_GRENI|nr:hypothetical protein GNI_016540 [Gregarina niphandrodes]EZG82429.1 hypothetical protein GNI_016540 [Gregarina niphandrodes]|eukprot:XP_011128998.1 hypothetical protein GNI_016540 [Gregarina niphandrodes]